MFSDRITKFHCSAEKKLLDANGKINVMTYRNHVTCVCVLRSIKLWKGYQYLLYASVCWIRINLPHIREDQPYSPVHKKSAHCGCEQQPPLDV